MIWRLTLAIALACCRPPAATSWAVYMSPEHVWLLDTCAHGSWTTDPAAAATYPTPAAARAALEAADIEERGLAIVPAP